ncbi:MAG: hypothetical protein ABL936_00370 [Aestuariivirga sp.]
MITRDFYYVAWHKHVVHFRTECPSYKRMIVAGKYMAQPKGKTLCDHCQAIEKRLKRIAKAEARRAKSG